jgi:hypothetical protein
MGLGKAALWGKRVGDHFHISKVGRGHSGALEGISGMRESFVLPEHTDFEVDWWDRTVRIDAPFRCYTEPKPINPLQIEDATIYANLVSIGNIMMFRRFFEACMKKTDAPFSYVERFKEMLNEKGKRELERKLPSRISRCRRALPEIKMATAACLGITRKRALLIPEWADLPSLWKEKEGKGAKTLICN